jgi:hypothetical protein
MKREPYPPVEDLQAAYVAVAKLIAWYQGKGRTKPEFITAANVPIVNSLSLSLLLIDVMIIKMRL